MTNDRPERRAAPADINTPPVRGRLNTIAHDFNNLLTVINGYSELLLKQLDEGDVREQVFEIRQAGARVSELNEELLSIVRPVLSDAEGMLDQAGAGISRVGGAAADVSGKAAAAVPKIASEPGGTETILLVEDQAELLRVSLRVLTGLGYTVLQAGTADEALRKAAQHQGPIDLLITDMVLPGSNGRDLAARLTSARPNLKALFVSGYPHEHLLAQHWLEPDSPFLAKPFQPAALAAAVRRTLCQQPTRATLLVVDDEEGVRKLLAGVLGAAGYEVVMASDGREAQRVLDARAVDLVLMDLVMPNREGIETISSLRRARPDLKIIAISGFGGTFLNVATRLGARAALAKPIGPDHLLQVVEEILGSD